MLELVPFDVRRFLFGFSLLGVGDCVLLRFFECVVFDGLFGTKDNILVGVKLFTFFACCVFVVRPLFKKFFF